GRRRPRCSPGRSSPEVYCRTSTPSGWCTCRLSGTPCSDCGPAGGACRVPGRSGPRRTWRCPVTEPDTDDRRGRSRGRWLVLAAVVLGLSAGIGAAVATGRDGTSGGSTTTTTVRERVDPSTAPPAAEPT